MVARGRAVSARVRGLQAALYFEPNVGQVSSEIRYVSRGRHDAFLTNEGIVFGRFESAVHFVGAGPVPSMEGLKKSPGVSNYYVGADSSNWHEAVSHFAELRHRGLYPGIDVLYHGKDGDLEFDYLISPGADPEKIRFTVSGPNSINADGSLTLGRSEIKLQRPRAYQMDGARLVPIECSFSLEPDGSIR